MAILGPERSRASSSRVGSSSSPFSVETLALFVGGSLSSTLGGGLLAPESGFSLLHRYDSGYYFKR